MPVLPLVMVAALDSVRHQVGFSLPRDVKHRKDEPQSSKILDQNLFIRQESEVPNEKPILEWLLRSESVTKT
ncbi:hypothetical protein C5Y97_17710 [Blastopirellula marina]|uniref:Uncharacterized protein n=1 Tax=Blastopirellula marina TaxID=124 RepID=A0A2S8FLB0_9BACT|nr:hypothetical protein C5Y98_17700 [Blastopirellula marina]PTL43139.1 hypothetical protein C5Y97_17710 [Blastopirellula marina]